MYIYISYLILSVLRELNRHVASVLVHSDPGYYFGK